MLVTSQRTSRAATVPVLLFFAVATVVCSLVGQAHAADVALDGAKLAVSSIDGSARISQSFTAVEPPDVPSPLLIDSDEVLRVSFTLKGTDGEKLPADKRPHQVVVQLQDGADASIATTSIVGIKPSSGKASWSQRMDRLPPVLLRGQSGEVKVSLLMGFFGNSAPVQLPLATLRLPLAVAASDAGAASSLREKNMAAQGFERLPERRHTFAVPAADQMPPAIVSLGVAAATLALPWVVLVALWSSVMSALTLKAPGSATLPFLGMLAVLDGLALLYWNGAGLTLFKMLPWLLLLSTITLVVGRNAFTEMRRVRLGKQQG